MMKKFALLPLAAVALAACNDSPTGLTAGDALLFASHGSILDPYEVSYEVNGDNVTLHWKWLDPEDSWDLVSFKIKKGGEEVTVDIPNSKPYTSPTVLVRSALIEDAEEGVYCVEVMAKYDGAPALTHHARECIEVELNGGLRFQVELRGQSNALVETLPFGKNAGTWNFQFVIKVHDGANWVYVTDCGDLSYLAITTEAKWLNPGTEERTATPDAAEPCSVVGALGGKAVYKVGVSNAYQSDTSNGNFEFTIAGSANENTVTFTAN